VCSSDLALGTYLDAGGKLFISGQDLGWEMNDQGGASLAWYHQYLHANFIIDNAGSNTVTGVTGDPISDGMTMSLVPAMNPYPDGITPYDAAASIIFTYNATYKAALKADTGVYKVVYLGFGYEEISTPANRNLLMQRILNWLLPDPAAAPEGAGPRAGISLRAFPNPAVGTASLSFRLPAAGPADLAIYAPDGSLVRTLVRGKQEAGLHTLRWDGRSNAGNPVPAGIYFYRLQADQKSPSGKLVLTR
jgi:hypothetical protein